MELSKLSNDVEAERVGTWVDLPGFPGMQVLAVSTKSRAYERMNARLIAARRREIQGLPEGSPALMLIYQDVAMECMRKVAIRDWRGVTKDGQPVAYDAMADAIFGTTPKAEAKERIAARAQYRDLIEAMTLAASRVGVVDRSDAVEDEEPEGDAGKDEPTKSDA